STRDVERNNGGARRVAVAAFSRGRHRRERGWTRAVDPASRERRRSDQRGRLRARRTPAVLGRAVAVGAHSRGPRVGDERHRTHPAGAWLWSRTRDGRGVARRIRGYGIRLLR